MKGTIKFLLKIICVLGILHCNTYAQESTEIKIKDLIFIPDIKSVNEDTSIITYQLICKINKIDIAQRIQLKIGTAMGMDDIFSLTGSVIFDNNDYKILLENKKFTVKNYIVNCSIDIEKSKTKTGNILSVFFEQDGQNISNVLYHKF